MWASGFSHSLLLFVALLLLFVALPLLVFVAVPLLEVEVFVLLAELFLFIHYSRHTGAATSSAIGSSYKEETKDARVED